MVQKIIRTKPTKEGTFMPTTRDMPSCLRGLSDGGISKYAYIGSMGPDVPYFEKLTKWNALAHKDIIGISRWADLLHYNKTGEFVINLIDIAKKATDDWKPRLMAFALGYLAHIAGDTIVHPYVNCFAGAYHNQVAGDKTHRTVEVHLDSWLARHYYARPDVSTPRGSWVWYVWGDNGRAEIGVTKEEKGALDTKLFEHVDNCFEITFGEKEKPREGFLKDCYSNFARNALDSGYDVALEIPNTPDPRLFQHPKADPGRYADFYLLKAAEVAKDWFRQALQYFSGGIDRGELRRKIGNWNLDTGYRVRILAKEEQNQHMTYVRFEHSWINSDIESLIPPIYTRDIRYLTGRISLPFEENATVEEVGTGCELIVTNNNKVLTIKKNTGVIEINNQKNENPGLSGLTPTVLMEENRGEVRINKNGSLSERIGRVTIKSNYGTCTINGNYDRVMVEENYSALNVNWNDSVIRVKNNSGSIKCGRTKPPCPGHKNPHDRCSEGEIWRCGSTTCPGHKKKRHKCP